MGFAEDWCTIALPCLFPTSDMSHPPSIYLLLWGGVFGAGAGSAGFVLVENSLPALGILNLANHGQILVPLCYLRGIPNTECRLTSVIRIQTSGLTSLASCLPQWPVSDAYEKSKLTPRRDHYEDQLKRDAAGNSGFRTFPFQVLLSFEGEKTSMKCHRKCSLVHTV